jgi:hypothetical protein
VRRLLDRDLLLGALEDGFRALSEGSEDVVAAALVFRAAVQDGVGVSFDL